jgi:hypothetical protein
MLTFTPGAWYLLFLCKGCKTKQILFPDLTKGESKLTASFTVVCSKCSHKATYQGEEIERYHHPLSARRAVA